MTTEEPEAGPAATRTILIVDDHPVVRRGLAAMIAGEPGLSVCGEATSHASALAEIERMKPDLAIVDLSLERSDGLELLKDLRQKYPEIPALVLSMHDESVYAERAFRAGARGYVTKQEMGGTVLAAIHRLLAGELYMSAGVGTRLVERLLGGHPEKRDSVLGALTDRELQVFRLLGEGKTTREIAIRLGRSIKTIDAHRENIKSKLKLDSGAELAHHATHWIATGTAIQ